MLRCALAGHTWIWYAKEGDRVDIGPGKTISAWSIKARCSTCERHSSFFMAERVQKFSNNKSMLHYILKAINKGAYPVANKPLYDITTGKYVGMFRDAAYINWEDQSCK